MKATEADVQEAVNVILSDTKSYQTALNYAVNYAKFALSMSGEELRVQCLYILSNISHWRHPKAKEVRRILKSFTGSK